MTEEVTMAGDADLWAWLQVFAAEWRQLALSCAVGLIAVTAASWLFVPMFRAEAVTVPAKEDGGNDLGALTSGLGGLATLAGINSDVLGGNQDEVIAYLESRELGMRFLEQSGAIPEMLKLSSVQFPIPRRQVPADEMTRKAYEIFQKKVRRVVVDKKVGVIRISMIWPDAGISAAWTNSYVRLADAELRAQTLTRYEAKRDFLSRQLAAAQSVELKEAIGRLMEGQLKLAAMGAARDNFALRIVDPAVPPLRTQRVSPNRVSFAILGLLIGLIFAAARIMVSNGAAGTRPADREPLLGARE
jgi:LPS O-antigen subunit length determinant protein (WzzB/FepE family)